jgi:hypothetical protein
VHVIKDPWEWHTPWRLVPLNGLENWPSSTTSNHNSSSSVVFPREARPSATSLDETAAAGADSPALESRPRAQSSAAADALHAGESGEHWALGFDFPDFDHSIARGVPRGPSEAACAPVVCAS